MTQDSTPQTRDIQQVKKDALWLRVLKGFGSVFGLFGSLLRISIMVALVAALFGVISYAMELDEQVKAQFEGKRWSLPARVFARPLELYKGKQVYGDHLEKELQLLSYHKVDEPLESGQYSRKNNNFVIHTRGFQFVDDVEPQRLVKLSIRGGRATRLKYVDSSKGELSRMRIEPLLIGNFYPSHKEDRILVRFEDLSPTLVNGLLAVEDKKFYEHQGINPAAIARALFANLKAGQTVQGGSTITQQLVKNFYLTNERSFERKAKEAIMAFLLELRYSKKEILEAYMNEIHLGQDGGRAIHGFGLAAQFYFNRPLRELKPEQIAMLVGLAKGSAHYNPRRHPERALERRNLVLSVMEKEQVLSAPIAAEARQRSLEIATYDSRSGASPFPAFLELVREHLKRDYDTDDVASNEGLMIFTTMDPVTQIMAETVLVKRTKQLERAHRIPKDKLNSAMVISTVKGGEVEALVGGRNVRFPGYNRALYAKRQIGSLVKPPVFLAAVDRKKKKYTLATRLSDGVVTVKLSRGKTWKPRNYDHRSMGYVTLFKALTHSRNTPSVRIGIGVGLNQVIQTLKGLGVSANIPPYPSILLGALEMSPVDVQQMYQSIASGGEYTPLRSIRKVMNADGKVLTRYSLDTKRIARSESVELIKFAMHHVTLSGTAKAVRNQLPAWKKVAGKTGTTNDKKDSWFAGFSGEHVVTVWVGRDDNKPTKMTGGTGALKMWGDMMRILPTKPLRVGRSSRLTWATVDQSSGLLFNPACGKAIRVPFVKGTKPRKTSYCAPPEPVAPVVPVGQPQPATGAAAQPQAPAAGTQHIIRGGVGVPQ